jgi:hypothetical protein
MGRFSEAAPPALSSASNGKEGCSVTQLLNSDQLDDDDREAINTHLARKRYSDSTVAEWLNALGAEAIVDRKMTPAIVMRHRSGKCCGGAGKVR